MINVLREWKLACPKGELRLVFPTAGGQIAGHNNVVRALAPVQAAGLTDQGEAEVHWPARAAALLCIVVHQPPTWRTGHAAEKRADRLGHSSIQMTADTYGHLFPAGTMAPNWPRPSMRCSDGRDINAT